MTRTKTKKHRTARAADKGLGLEVYAFWTGFASTLISLFHVLIVAAK
ncbi:MAG: hypothetical protein V4644_02815 [Patescibacteria group bacterium]